MRCCRRARRSASRTRDRGGLQVNAPPAAASHRNRRLARAAGGVALVLLLLALSLRVALRPEHVTGLVLERIGTALGLEITATGIGEYRLRGTPQLVVRDVVAREPGARTAVLKAGRVAISVPWSTLRSRGTLLQVDRVELEGAVLDLPALQAWQAKRPAGETRIPTLTRGLSITDARIDAAGWRLEGLRIELPALHPGRPVSAQVAGRYVDPPTRAAFDLHVALAKPASRTGAAASGSIVVSRGAARGATWRLPGTIRVSGPLHLGDGRLRITPARIGLTARYESGDTRLPFALGLHGPLLVHDGAVAIAPAGVALRGDGVLPVFDARGRVALGRRLLLELDGQLPGWKDAWPALPPPLGQSRSPLPFRLRYLGRPDAGSVATLRLRRDATAFDARFRLPEMLGWANARRDGSPLPPLDGRLTTPRMEISGATLHGVEIDFDDPDVEAAPTDKPAGKGAP
jgi:hypothetical protein